jgi:hypothetical protein
MFSRTKFLAAAAVSSALFVVSAGAHDPSEFERTISAPAAKAVPTTCEQLADPTRYSNDVTNPDIKALKTRCDAAKKATVDKGQ